MKIMAHRGWWLDATEKNSRTAFSKALANGFGIETDIRDCGQELVISHDSPLGNEMPFRDFLALCGDYPASRPLALNIKADGLSAVVAKAVTAAGIKDFFVFDMSVPDALGYLRAELPVYTRLSEYENPPAYLELASGIWLDAFHSTWYGMTLLSSYLASNQPVAIVSPELHQRPHLTLWQQLRAASLHRHPLIALCTDFPDQAQAYFND